MNLASELRRYNPVEVAAFRSTKGEFGGLSNMAPGFPLLVNEIKIRTSEALYQACRFPHLPEIQRMILEEKSPMTAKMRSKPYRAQSRGDWMSVRVKIMRWCLRLKLAQNWQRFGELLYATEDLPIVEDSAKDDFWGAIPQEDGQLVGRNVLGRLLMEVRAELRSPEGNKLRKVPLPGVTNVLLLGKPVVYAELDNGTIGAGPLVHEGSEISIETKKMTQYVKRLIEVDLPIRRISEHARREKSIRHGHISTLHIWWARRPLAACRAVICAALWPDPADERCPAEFREKASKLILEFARKVTTDTKLATEHCSPENFKAWSKLVSSCGRSTPNIPPLALRSVLLDFIADFANWDNSTVREYLDTSRALTQAAPEALGGAPGTRPLVVDPFCGGGSIPLEALRVGADAFASDLNPIPVLLNKVVLEYIPKYGQLLADEVRKWGEWIKGEAEKELAEFYPKDPDGATPIAYLWARTIQCEGPGCGAEVPLIRAPWLVKKDKRSVAFQLVPNKKAKQVDFQIIVKEREGWVDQANANVKIESPNFDGTVKRGSATCRCCGYTTPVARVRVHLKA
jgi:ribA/ribD-fused uncharacterized protein